MVSAAGKTARAPRARAAAAAGADAEPLKESGAQTIRGRHAEPAGAEVPCIGELKLIPSFNLIVGSGWSDIRTSAIIHDSE
jgi:hypothetical protein